MVCPCCVQCGIKSIATSVTVTFKSTFRPWWVGSDPCYSPVSLYFCPYETYSPDTDSFGRAFAESSVRGEPAVDSQPYSGACNRYDGSYVIDYENDAAEPSGLTNQWCSSAGTNSCPPNFLAHWHQWNRSGYQASCSSVSAWHAMTGTSSTKWFVAVIESAPQGTNYQSPGVGLNSYSLIDGPQNLGSAGGRSWYKTRYSYRSPGGIANSFNDTQNRESDRDQFALCLSDCPELDVG
jgi:hypothetical protein